jgi:hypothetical protein
MFLFKTQNLLFNNNFQTILTGLLFAPSTVWTFLKSGGVALKGNKQRAQRGKGFLQ